MESEFGDDGTRPTLFRTVARSTVSITATPDNLPRPGRNVANLFKNWEEKIEDVLTELNAHQARRRGTRNEPPESAPLSRTTTISSVNTNATADNLPGPGRLLGNAYSFLGGYLVHEIEHISAELGNGPQNVALRIAERDNACKVQENGVCRWIYNSEADRAQKKDLERLINYAW